MMRSLDSKFLKLTILGIYAFTLYPAQSTFAEDKGKIVHFPKNRSMGMLYLLDSDKVNTSSYNEWEVLCEATGEVAVPAGKALRLNLSKEAGNDLAPLSKLRPNDLVMLFCYGIEIPDAELKHISHLTGLQELYMRDTGILGTGLKYLANLKSLEKLRVDNTHVGDSELAYLADLSSLKSLNLWATPTSDVGMIHVGKITSLEELTLSRGIGDEGLSHLKNLTSLRYLSSGSQSTSDEGLAHLANMTEMEILYLRETQVGDKGLVHLKKMKKLRRLHLHRTNITENGLVHLVGLKDLELLELPIKVTDNDLIYLSQLPSLKSIDINSDLITTKGLAALRKMKSLERIEVYGTQNTDEIIGQLSGLTGLKSLNIRRGMTDEGLIYLKNTKSLEELHLNGVLITGKGFEILAELPLLRALSISDMEIPSKECWINLGKLASLQRVELDKIQSRITNENIECLTSLFSLKHLNISPDRKQPINVTDMALKHISKFQSLEHLTFHRMGITDKGLKHLEKLDSLQWLDLQGCKVTEKGLQRLKKKLPALRWHLDQSSSSTLAPSLAGKSLLALNNFKPNQSLTEGNEKKILVCFFDVEQRPSRSYLRQLNAKIQELEAKNVVPIAIQASKMDQRMLSAWAKKNRIPFPIGIVHGDTERIRLTWGTRSLPWLILTDRKHTVTAEGFGLGQLDEKL